MTRARAKDDQAVTRPTASTNASMPSANLIAEVTSALKNLAVINRLAVAGPLLELGHVGHVGVVDLLGHWILGDRLCEYPGVGFAQRLNDGVGEGLGDDALVLDQVLHRLGIVLL